jgi:hypothetical protein
MARRRVFKPDRKGLGVELHDLLKDVTAFDVLVDVLAGTVEVEELEPRGFDFAYVELLPYGMRAQAELGDRGLRAALAELAAALFAGPSAAEAFIGVLARVFAAKEVPLEVRLRVLEWQPDLSGYVLSRRQRAPSVAEEHEAAWGE